MESLSMLFAVAPMPGVSADEWLWKALVPLLSLILGILVKSLIDLYVETARDKAARELRIEQRQDALRQRRNDSERANLLTLQPDVARLFRSTAAAHFHDAHQFKMTSHWGNTSIAVEEQTVMESCILGMQPVIARLHALEIQEKLNSLVVLVSDRSSAGSSDEGHRLFDAFRIASRDLTLAIGARIRELEEEGLEPVKPSDSSRVGGWHR